MKLNKQLTLQMTILRCLCQKGEQDANEIGLYCEKILGYNPRDPKIASTHKALRPLVTMGVVMKIPQPHPKPYRYHVNEDANLILLYLETMQQDGKVKKSGV